jgi:hypothetical protein
VVWAENTAGQCEADDDDQDHREDDESQRFHKRRRAVTRGRCHSEADSRPRPTSPLSAWESTQATQTGPALGES